MSAFVEIPATKLSIAKRKLVYGVGVNDAPYITKPTINGKQVCCHFYATWNEMIRRCYDPKFQKKRPTYAGCSVAPEWLSFMAFRSWMIEQDWDGKALDKDTFVVSNKAYSPSTCLFISHALNNLLNDSAAARGRYPIGVSKHGKKYRAKIRINGKPKHLGTFTTPAEASAAYRRAKSNHLIAIAEKQTDQRVTLGLYRHAKAISQAAA